MKKDTIDNVLNFFKTFENNTDWTFLLSNTIKFTSPLDSDDNKDAFIQLDLIFRKLVTSTSIKEIIVENTKAAVLVDYKMALPRGETLTIEFSDFIEVNDLKISSIKVFFDVEKFKIFFIKNAM